LINGNHDNALQKALPISVLDTLRQELNIELQSLLTLLNISTEIWVDRQAAGVFSISESAHITRVRKSFIAASSVFQGDRDQAADWLRSPITALAGRTPISLCATEVGGYEVIQVIRKLETGEFT